jgi:hypothetical protein
MNTKNFLLALIFPVFSFAQIGIGTSTVDASAKLQIDATDRGFLQPRVELTGTDDVATIATPATGLMVFNTATAGSGAAAVSPGVYYHNGAAWQRVANQAEVAAATASTTTFVNGDLGSLYVASGMGSGQQGDLWSPKTFNANIILPPGKWEVVLELAADIQIQSQLQPTIPYMNYWLAHDTQTVAFNYFSTIPNNEIGSDALFTGGASFFRPINYNHSNHKGSFFINNSTQANKTYTLYFFETLPGQDCQFDNCISAFYYNRFGGQGWPGNRFYATKIN